MNMVSYVLTNSFIYITPRLLDFYYNDNIQRSRLPLFLYNHFDLLHNNKQFNTDNVNIIDKTATSRFQQLSRY